MHSCRTLVRDWDLNRPYSNLLELGNGASVLIITLVQFLMCQVEVKLLV